MTRAQQMEVLFNAIQRPHPMFLFYLKQRERVLWTPVYATLSEPFLEARLFNRNALLITADRVKAMCPDCKSEPSRPGAPIRHRIGCRSSLQTHVKE